MNIYMFIFVSVQMFDTATRGPCKGRSMTGPTI
jgi:hypothetical protein